MPLIQSLIVLFIPANTELIALRMPCNMPFQMPCTALAADVKADRSWLPIMSPMPLNCPSARAAIDMSTPPQSPRNAFKNIPNGVFTTLSNDWMI